MNYPDFIYLSDFDSPNGESKLVTVQRVPASWRPILFEIMFERADHPKSTHDSADFPLMAHIWLLIVFSVVFSVVFCVVVPMEVAMVVPMIVAMIEVMAVFALVHAVDL